MDQSNISYKSIFILFLMIITNYLSDILPLSIRKVFFNNLLLKHIFSFLVLFFFIMVVNPEQRALPYLDLLRNGLLIYIIFYMMCCSKGIYFIISIIISCLLYIMHLKEDNLYLSNISNNKNIDNKYIKKYNKYNTPKRKEIIKIIKKILIILLYITVISGVVHRLYDKKLKFKNNFNFWKFILIK